MSDVYTRLQLLSLGQDDSSIRRQVRLGLLTRVRDGWYATPGAEPHVLIAVRQGGALTCASALKLYRFWVPPGYAKVHVRGPREHRPGFCRHHGRPRPVPTAVDSIALSLACAAKCMTAEDFIVAADSVLNKRGLTVAGLRSALTGIVDAKTMRLLNKCDPRAQSGTETLARVRLRARGYKVQVQPRRPSGGHSDLAIGRLIIECDSRQHHLLDEAQYEKDRLQDRKSLLVGRPTFRLTYAMVIHHWDDALADIAEFVRADRHRDRRRC